MESNKTLVTINDPHSFLSESYRICRANINYMNIDNNYQVLMLTSSVPSEGKTTTSCNLAITIAQSDKKVLLIDGDLRKSKIHKVFKLNSFPGLTDAIYEKLSLSDIVQHIESVPGLDILVSGKSTPKPAELLGSDSFKKLLNEAKNLYDIIIIDSPPVLTVSDTVIISQLVNGVLLIVAAKETNKDVVLNAKKTLEKVGVNIMGIILTKTKVKNGNYYYSDK
jgi:capsular exopolysaccharide synthesis family protein